MSQYELRLSKSHNRLSDCNGIILYQTRVFGEFARYLRQRSRACLMAVTDNKRGMIFAGHP